jgi:hypothetical protein
METMMKGEMKRNNKLLTPLKCRAKKKWKLQCGTSIETKVIEFKAIYPWLQLSTHSAMVTEIIVHFDDNILVSSTMHIAKHEFPHI